MGQTAMYTPNPTLSGVSVHNGRGYAKEYTVKDQICTVDDDFLPAMRALGFMTAAEANIRALELKATAAAAAGEVAEVPDEKAIAKAAAAEAKAKADEMRAAADKLAKIKS